MLDSRDLQKKLDELLSAYQDWEDGEADALDEFGTPEEVKAKINELESLATDVGDEWNYGATLIEESEFEDHARELAEDCGMLPDNPSWPLTCIDWERAAEELQQDYSQVEYQGETYYVRG